ncbi:MAG: lipopolysaccharide transport periplasmic protein LptA [Betaproteobacteria bacterium]|jgi:lipopolysaccharide export system protein LptA
MKKLLISIFFYNGFIGFSCFTSSPSYALKSDQDQPIKLFSDNADFNDVTQEYVLTGHAIIIKGSLKVTGDKAVIVTDPEGFQKISVIAKAPNIATFSQQMDGPNHDLTDGQGELIIHEAKTDKLLISGNAIVKRLRGSVVKDLLISDQIDYDLLTEKYIASIKTPGKLVKSTLAPRTPEKFKITD